MGAARAADTEVILLCWSVGKDIIEKQETLGWGAKVIQQLSTDLRREFPDQAGWSPTNLKYRPAFAKALPDPDAIGPQLVDQLPKRCVPRPPPGGLESLGAPEHLVRHRSLSSTTASIAVIHVLSWAMAASNGSSRPTDAARSG
ncbi:MAG: DUF1016 N-terminal domain-containing protein [Bifidobacteriaceae bacterium]|nr:DUF1016 N-terminal domain-containing protein [Bifidobacteriaceae bacterium]